MICAIYLLFLIGRCVWPLHCGEGFAAGFTAGSVIVGMALWALLWLISEGLMWLCSERSPPEEG